MCMIDIFVSTSTPTIMYKTGSLINVDYVKRINIVYPIIKINHFWELNVKNTNSILRCDRLSACMWSNLLRHTKIEDSE